MASRNDVNKAFAAMASMHSKIFTQAAIDMLVADFENYDPDAVLMALGKCRKEIPRFPTVAEIIARIQGLDGRPGAEEAWALAPKGEHDAAYLNDEIMAAWAIAAELLASGDSLISARMAFKEVYDRRVRQSRDSGQKPKWWLSRASGGDRDSANIRAIEIAAQAGRISKQDALLLLPVNYSDIKTNQAIRMITDAQAGGLINHDEASSSLGEVIKTLEAQWNPNP